MGIMMGSKGHELHKQMLEQIRQTCFWCHKELIEPQEQAQGVHEPCESEHMYEMQQDAKEDKHESD